MSLGKEETMPGVCPVSAAYLAAQVNYFKKLNTTLYSTELEAYHSAVERSHTEDVGHGTSAARALYCVEALQHQIGRASCRERV